MGKIKILLVDDHALFREGLRFLHSYGENKPDNQLMEYLECAVKRITMKTET